MSHLFATPMYNKVIFSLNTERPDEVAAVRATMRWHGCEELIVLDGVYNGKVEQSYAVDVKFFHKVWQLAKFYEQECVMYVNGEGDAYLSYMRLMDEDEHIGTLRATMYVSDVVKLDCYSQHGNVFYYTN